MRRRPLSLILIALAVLAAGAAFNVALIFTPGTVNFSQRPGFEAALAASPPGHEPPGPADMALLRRHRPHFYLPRGHAGLIGFYEDYIAQGTLRDGDGNRISSEVTREILNAHKNEPMAVFVHRPDPEKPQTPVVFGKVERRTLDIGGAPLPVIFLTYHAVFRHSGLVADLPAWLAFPVWLFGLGDDWHQLDHYTAATVMLTTTTGTAAPRPAALMLQQHNYARSYIFGEEIAAPGDGRVKLDVALRSNELYPHEDGRERHRAVRFLSPEAFRYMLGAGDRPVIAGFDVTEPALEADYDLKAIAPDDAFYMFRGFLGERRWGPGRSGPPGAWFNTLPGMKPMTMQVLSGYWRSGDKGDIARLSAVLAQGGGEAAFARAQGPVFAANLACAMRRAGSCAFE